MNTVKTVQINAMVESIKTIVSLINYALEERDFEFLEIYNQSLQTNMGILSALRSGVELDYMQEATLDGVVMAIQEIQREEREHQESEEKRKDSLTYKGNNNDIIKDGSLLKAVKIKDLKEGDFFILNNKGRTVYTRGHYDRSENDYTCTDFMNTSREKYFKGNKTVLIGFTF
jgi:hypothetical protein